MRRPPQRRKRERRAVIPRATYRIQLNAGFTLRDATALVPYLAGLGISHVYCSPYFAARPGSMHGYDVVDHGSLNPEIGTAQDLEQFVATLRTHGMGQLLDIVPNHVGIMGAGNAWWMDVLESGQASKYAQFFDIDWQPPNPALAGRLLVPVLGDPYGVVLERGELRLKFEGAAGSFAVFYHEHRFPLDPRTYPWILEKVLARLDAAELRSELESLIEAFRSLPDRDSPSPERNETRAAQKEAHKHHLAGLVRSAPALALGIESALAAFTGAPGTPSSFDPLHALLELQVYRLAYWRVAADDINYRRFFDVNDLAALRMENENVFEATHRLALELVRTGKVDGLRVDHPDGLYDPAQYFDRLQQHVAGAPDGHKAAGGRGLPLYLIVEKVTAPFERLPASWPVHGTTGYRFANVVNGLFVDGRARNTMDRTYRAFIVDYVEWPEVVYESKALILRTSLAAELNVLANQLARIAEADRHTRDFTLSNLRAALIEVIAWFPVYRTYVVAAPSAADRRYIDWAVGRAQRRSSITNTGLFDFVRTALLADVSRFAEAAHPQLRAFAMKFQQVTAPVAAKGVEDTALYRFTRLASLNEVGGDPAVFGVSVRRFHADCRHRAGEWPHEMLATSTHDTKRSEDVRARINVLSEMPRRWRRSLRRWSHMNRARRRLVDEQPAPGPHAEYLFYQTLIGTWPLHAPGEAEFAAYRGRIEQYMVKAMREAKRRTAWLNVNAEYEEALCNFIRAALEQREGNLFLEELATFARGVARIGFLNSLSTTLCKLTAPGVPDIYQGNELWDFSLVDPDNRRPVDYPRRRQALAELQRACSDPARELDGLIGSLLQTPEDGRVKLYLTWRALALRRAHETLFREGAYLPMQTRGEHAPHVCAFARQLAGDAAVVAVPRLCERLLGARAALPLGGEVWADTVVVLPSRISARTFNDVFTGARIEALVGPGAAHLRAADVFARFPVALLVAG